MSNCEDCPDYGRDIGQEILDSLNEVKAGRKKKPTVVIDGNRHIVGQIARHDSTTPQSTDSANGDERLLWKRKT